MERKIHIYYHSQVRRDIVMQITDLYKIPMEAKSSCTFTLMAKGDKAECHYNPEAKGIFTLKL